MYGIFIHWGNIVQVFCCIPRLCLMWNISGTWFRAHMGSYKYKTFRAIPCILFKCPYYEAVEIVSSLDASTTQVTFFETQVGLIIKKFIRLQGWHRLQNRVLYLILNPHSNVLIFERQIISLEWKTLNNFFKGQKHLVG